MKIALYTRAGNPADADSGRYLDRLRQLLAEHSVEVVEDVQALRCGDSSQSRCDFVLSIGGDGTLLSAAHLVVPMQIPIVGINFGHLGFLTTAGKEYVENLVADLIEGKYDIEYRTLLQVSADTATDPSDTPLALNEVTLRRSDAFSLLKTEVYVNGQFVSHYSADGIIVATPTGSTAYSLSCGGPILTPDSGSFVITPIAAHSLSLRPIVVSDSAHIKLVPQRSGAVLSVDSDSYQLRDCSEITLVRADLRLPLVRLRHQHFFNALHEKLAL